MLDLSANNFERLVMEYFSPIAKGSGSDLVRLDEEFFEVRAQKFAVRIRRGTGHRKDFLVTLASTSSDLANSKFDLRNELGLRVVVT